MKVRSERLSDGGALGRDVKFKTAEIWSAALKHTSSDERQGEGKIITFDIVEATFCADSFSIKDFGRTTEQASRQGRRKKEGEAKC